MSAFVFQSSQGRYQFKDATHCSISNLFYDCPSKANCVFSTSLMCKPGIGKVRRGNCHKNNLLFRVREHWWRVSQQKTSSEYLMKIGPQYSIIQIILLGSVVSCSFWRERGYLLDNVRTWGRRSFAWIKLVLMKPLLRGFLESPSILFIGFSFWYRSSD